MSEGQRDFCSIAVKIKIPLKSPFFKGGSQQEHRNKTMGIGLLLIIILAAVALWIIAIYNGLITLKNRVDEAWSDIEVQLKRRYDLIPNLVNTVKGYAAHETGVFEKVTEAR